MDELDRQQLLEQPALVQVLQIYSELIDQAGEERADDDQGTRWANRIVELTDVAAEELSSIHGQLIANGWLTFQLEGKVSGLMYRMTADGRKACEWAVKNAVTAMANEAA